MSFRSPWTPLAGLALALGSASGLSAQERLGPPRTDPPLPMGTLPSNLPQTIPDLDARPGFEPLLGPREANIKPPVQLPETKPKEGEVPLAINLPSALMLSDARPLIIDAAKAAEGIAAAQLEKANVLWFPNIYAGIDYFYHTGQYPSPSTGTAVYNSRNSITIGPGVSAVFATTDAIFEPLAARQMLRARGFGVQAAKNDALMEVAIAYFNVQQHRGRLAGALDTVAKARELTRRAEILGKDLAAPVEGDRARTLQADLEQIAARAREDWQVASADLARVLRLNPMAAITPVEPPHLAMLLIAPSHEVDQLVPLGLTNRPELGSAQAVVQATLARLKQEKMRPLIPSLVLQGNSGANGNGAPLFGAASAAGPSSMEWSNRFDINAAAIWELKNFGFGNRALVREREAQRQYALVELFQTQDKVAAEVVQAHAQLRNAAARVSIMDTGLKKAIINFEGNMKGMSETTRFGDVLVLVNRPQEVVAALQQLDTAYRTYFESVQDYNRAQFRLFRAVGYPAEVLACQKVAGELLPIDATRPFDLPPVTGIPCAEASCAPLRAAPIAGESSADKSGTELPKTLPAPKADSFPAPIAPKPASGQPTTFPTERARPMEKPAVKPFDRENDI